MKVREAMEKMSHMNPEAELEVTANNRSYSFSFAWSSGGDCDDSSPRDLSKVKVVSIYVDVLNKSEKE